MSYAYEQNKYVVRLLQMGFTKVGVSKDSTAQGVVLTYRVRHPDIEGVAKFSAPSGDGHMERMLRAAKEVLRSAYVAKEEAEAEPMADTVKTPSEPPAAEEPKEEPKVQRKAKVKK